MDKVKLTGLIVFLVILILFSAIFSAAETSYSSVSKVKLNYMYKKKFKSAKLIKKQYKSFGWTLATILISNNLVNIASTSILTYVITKYYSGSSAAIITTFIMTPIIVIFGEIIPKLIAKKYPYQYLSKICYLIQFFNWIFFPITFFLSKITLQSKITNTEGELKSILSNANKEGVLEKHEATLAKKALDFDSKIVNKIMIKKNQIVYVDKNYSVKKALEVFKETGFSRLPVVDEKKFIGIIFLKDVLFSKNNKIERLIEKPLLISRYINISNVLKILRINNEHMAFVTKSKNNKDVVGIVTLEDVVEELIGEIYDEHDEFVDEIKEIEFHKYIVEGTINIEKLSEKFKTVFENSEGMTLRQWIQSKIKRRIRKNLIYVYKNKFKFKIIENKKNKESLIEITIR